MTRRDLVVIGGGAGGLVVASVASQLGLGVTLVEKEPALGGDCLHYRCVPSKALIHAARVVATARQAAEFGAGPVPAAVDFGRVADYVRGVIDRLQLHDDPDRFRGYGCEVLFGAAEFVDPQTVRVDGRLVRGRRFVIATGSHALIPPVDGLAEAGFLTHRMKVGAGLADISATIHAYPTLAQFHRRAANMAYAPKLFRPATRRLVRWMQRLVP